MQHHRFQTGLLQCTVEWRTSGDFDKLQRTQNNLARVVFQSRGRTDARALLHWLHWLPVRQRITYKLAVLTHKVRTTATPTYLSELVETHAPPRALCSSDAPNTRHSSHTHRTGPLRFFFVSAPFTWNSLPADIRLCENILTFKRHLKTLIRHVFSTVDAARYTNCYVCMYVFKLT